jgi:hypothetical protein
MKRTLLFCVLLVASSIAWGAEASASWVVAPAPSWVLNPDKPGYLSVVGSAPKQDWGGRDAQYRVALMKARRELAQIIRVRVTSTTQSTIADDNGKSTRQTDIETKLQSNVEMKLDSARVIEEWVDPQNGSLYLWLTTPE